MAGGVGAAAQTGDGEQGIATLDRERAAGRRGFGGGGRHYHGVGPRERLLRTLCGAPAQCRVGCDEPARTGGSRGRKKPRVCCSTFIDGHSEQGRFVMTIPAAPGRRERRGRSSRCALRRWPCAGRSTAPTRHCPRRLSLTLVDVREVSEPEDGSAPVHWRLLTTPCCRCIERRPSCDRLGEGDERPPRFKLPPPHAAAATACDATRRHI